MGRRAGKASKKSKAKKARKAQNGRQRSNRDASYKKNRRRKDSSSSSDSCSSGDLSLITTLRDGPLQPRGLSNLGNTCFFNAITQAIAQVKRMRYYFVEMNHQDEELEAGMTKHFREFMKSMWHATDRSTYSPDGLFDEIGKRAPRFKGRAQQDSHEALRFILDGLIDDEEKRKRESQDENDDDSDMDREFERRVSYIESTFQGILASSITCRTCGHSSTVTEPFCDLSVPLVLNSADEPKSVTEKAKPVPQVSSRAVIPLPPPPSLVPSNMGRSATASSVAPKSVQEELRQKVATFSPVESENEDDTEDVPLLSGVNTMEIEEDADEGLAQWANNFGLDTPNEEESDAVVCGPMNKEDSEKKTEEKAPSKSSRIFPLSFPSLRGRGDKYKSLEDSVAEFTKPEILEGENAYGCEECTRRKKRMLLFQHAQALSEADSISEVTSEESSDAPEKVNSMPFQCRGPNTIEETMPEGTFSPVTTSESDSDEDAEKVPAPLVNGSNVRKLKKCVNEKVATVRTTAEKMLQIRSAPPCLIVQLKRFQQVSLRGNPRKISGHVKFSTELSLDDFMESPNHVRHQPRGKKASVKSAESHGNNYLLTGVVVHGGSLFGGHYTSYVRNADEWYYCNDARVSKAQEKDVLASEAYVLVYEKV